MQLVTAEGQCAEGGGQDGTGKLNIVIRNQDDHVRNIAFLMNPKGEWRLSPALDALAT